MRDWVPESELCGGTLAEQVQIVRGNICSQHLIERILGEYEIDSVFHLAAQTLVGVANQNPISTFDTNIKGTWTMLEACRHSPTVKQIILASSDKAYGDHLELPYNEEFPLRGRHPYDVSKSCADLIGQNYAATYKLPVAITRCGNFYGGGDLNWSRLVPGTIRSIIRGKRPLIRSDGTYIRDYFYIEDGVHAYMHLARCLAEDPTLRGQAFNFSDETQISVLQLTETILTKMDSSLRPEIRSDASGEIKHQYLSAEKARRVLGWKPQFTLDHGLDNTIRWYRTFFQSNKRSL